jgi:DNA-binding response OmpR family regulator
MAEKPPSLTTTGETFDRGTSIPAAQPARRGDPERFDVLVVSPDATRRRGLSRLLTLIGWRVRDAAALKSGLLQAPCEPIWFVVLDWKNGDAREVADIQWLKARASPVAILVVCPRGQVHPAARALEAGATDFITDPFNGCEVLARCWRFATAQTSTHQRMSFGALSIDFDRQTVTLKGRRTNLTRSEFAVLSYLALRPNTVIADAEIVTMVLGDTYNPDCTILRAHVCRLRRKLGIAGRLIQTVRGQGHRLQTSASVRLRGPGDEPINATKLQRRRDSGSAKK